MISLMGMILCQREPERSTDATLLRVHDGVFAVKSFPERLRFWVYVEVAGQATDPAQVHVELFGTAPWLSDTKQLAETALRLPDDLEAGLPRMASASVSGTINPTFEGEVLIGVRLDGTEVARRPLIVRRYDPDGDLPSLLGD